MVGRRAATRRVTGPSGVTGCDEGSEIEGGGHAGRWSGDHCVSRNWDGLGICSERHIRRREASRQAWRSRGVVNDEVRRRWG